MSDADEELLALLEENETKVDAKKQLRKKISSQTTNSSDGGDNGLNNIKLNVKLKNSVTEETLRTKFSGDDYVRKVARTIAEELTSNGNSINDDAIEKMGLFYMGKALDKNKKLKEAIYKVNEKYLAIQVSFHVDGGAAAVYDEKYDENRERIVDFKKGKSLNIKPTLKPDCIYGWDEKKLRVKMPCGHVFAPETLFKITKMYVHKLSKCKILCPILSCKQEWSFDIVAVAADLDEKEIINFSNILSKREMMFSGNFQECKGCNGLVSKPKNVKKIRVRCSAKSCSGRSDFCWYCGKDWIGGGFTICGNKDCGTYNLNTVLQTCEMVEPKYLDGLKCPEYRHCPRCLTLVAWASACKHIRCWGCNKRFCFVCLSLEPEDGKWPCGDHRYKCEVKARQSLK